MTKRAIGMTYIAATIGVTALAASAAFSAPIRAGKLTSHKPVKSQKAPADLKPRQNLTLIGKVSGTARQPILESMPVAVSAARILAQGYSLPTTPRRRLISPQSWIV